MAQLPPNVPNMTQNWPSFPYHIMTSPAAATAAQQPSWVDEFLDFSSARRSAHRRSASDSIAFVQQADDCRNSNSPAAAHNGFEGLDDEQLMNMLADDAGLGPPLTLSSPSPSTPSDQNSNNDEKATAGEVVDQQQQQQQQLKNEAGEVDSSSQSEPQKQTTSSASASGDNLADPKRVKRILANRQSAQRSRVRKLQYISELERSVTSLQTEVSALSPRVAFLDHQRLVLNVDNSALKQRIAALAQDKIFKDAHQEALKKEIERLRHVYHQQSLKKSVGSATASATAPPPPPSATCCTDKEQHLN